MKTLQNRLSAVWIVLAASACTGGMPMPDVPGQPADTGRSMTDAGVGVDVPASMDATTRPDTGMSGAVVTYGQVYSGGQFHLGPVDYTESQWHNACAPGTKYDTRVRAVEGQLLAGIWNGIANTAGYCDACIYVTTGMGRNALLRVVTYGDTTQNSIDVSPEAYQILNAGEFPRAMTWQFAKCPDSGPMMYEFQTGSNQWWTSLWVRNARVPVTKVEVRSANHTNFVQLQRAGDGTVTDASGFGMGTFSIRTTGVDGQTVTDTFTWPTAGIAGAFLTGQTNFQ